MAAAALRRAQKAGAKVTAGQLKRAQQAVAASQKKLDAAEKTHSVMLARKEKRSTAKDDAATKARNYY